MVTASLSPSAETKIQIHLRGGNLEFWRAREQEILVEGPRGTGKTRTILELINALCQQYPGLTALIVRKFQRTLSTTCLRTLNEQVLHNGDGVSTFGGNDNEPSGYRYRNGSRIVTGGMDNSDKVKSSEYDIIYCNEATEITEDDWESLLPLLRHQIEGNPVIEHQRIIGDCNPANSGHWINQRCERGVTRRIRTRIHDNPSYYEADGTLTVAGAAYLATLGRLTGARRERWLEGRWTGVENACYPQFDRLTHIRPLEPGLAFKATIIWEDYGSVHRCSIGALSIDQYNRRWVRECWGQPDTDQGKSINLIVSQYKERYHTRRGRVDPNQAYLAGQHGFNVAKGGNGGAAGKPRLHRIDLLEPLFYSYAGGRVPTFREEKGLMVPRGPFAEPDSPGLFLVEGAPGIDELADQIEGYHYVYSDTPKGRSKDVYRDNEDHVAGLEYANEEWEEGEPSSPLRISVPVAAELNSGFAWSSA